MAILILLATLGLSFIKLALNENAPPGTPFSRFKSLSGLFMRYVPRPFDAAIIPKGSGVKKASICPEASAGTRLGGGISAKMTPLGSVCVPMDSRARDTEVAPGKVPTFLPFRSFRLFCQDF